MTRQKIIIRFLIKAQQLKENLSGRHLEFPRSFWGVWCRHRRTQKKNLAVRPSDHILPKLPTPVIEQWSHRWTVRELTTEPTGQLIIIHLQCNIMGKYTIFQVKCCLTLARRNNQFNVTITYLQMIPDLLFYWRFRQRRCSTIINFPFHSVFHFDCNPYKIFATQKELGTRNQKSTFSWTLFFRVSFLYIYD